MRPLMMAFAVLALAAVIGYADEDKKDKSPSLTDLRKEFMAAYKKDKDAAPKEFAPKFLQVAQAGGKDGYSATMMTLQLSAMSKNADIRKKAAEILKKDHLDNPLFEKTLSSAARFLGEDGKPIFTELMEKGKTDKLKVAACTALLEGLESQLSEAKGAQVETIKKDLVEMRKVAVDKFKMKDLFIGATLPDLKSENLDGKEVKLSDYKGKVVVLDVWATWCPPCRAMIPHERELVDRMKGKPFALVSISFDEEKETLTKFLEKEKMPWSHWWNGRSGELGKQLNIRFYPTIFVLDGKGVIRYKGVRGEAMDKAVETLLKEMDDTKKSS